MTVTDDSWFDRLLADVTTPAPQELRESVRELIGSESASVRPSQYGERRRWLAPLSVAATAVLVVGGLVLLGGGDTPSIDPSNTTNPSVSPPPSTLRDPTSTTTTPTSTTVDTESAASAVEPPSVLTVRTDRGLPFSLDDFADGGAFTVFPWGEGLIAARASGPSPIDEERQLSFFYAPASETTAQWQQIHTDLPTEIIDEGYNVSVTVAGERLVVYTEEPEQTRYRLLIATTLDLETWEVDALEIERPPALPETVDWTPGTWSPVIFSDNGWIARINVDSWVDYWPLLSDEEDLMLSVDGVSVQPEWTASGLLLPGPDFEIEIPWDDLGFGPETVGAIEESEGQQVWVGGWDRQPIRTNHDFQSERLFAVGDQFIRFPVQGENGWSSPDGVEWAPIEIPTLNTTNGVLFTMPFGGDVVVLAYDVDNRQVTYRVDASGTWHPIKIAGVPDGLFWGDEGHGSMAGWSGIGPSQDRMFTLPNSPHLLLETTEDSTWLILTDGQDWFADLLFDHQD